MKGEKTSFTKDISAGSKKTKSGRAEQTSEFDTESDNRTAGIDDAFYGRAGSH